MTHIDLTDIRISDAGLFSKEPLTGSGDNPAEPEKRANLLPWLRSMQARHTTRRLAGCITAIPSEFLGHIELCKGRQDPVFVNLREMNMTT